MNLSEISDRVAKLRFELENVDFIIRGLRKKRFEKGSYISVLRLHTISMRIYDLVQALDHLSEVETNIIGGITQ